MKVTTRLLLPEDVSIAPVDSDPAESSRRVSHEAGDFLVTRAPPFPASFVVDVKTAALLEHFRAPSTVIDAVLAFCRTRELDPRLALDDSFITLTDLVAASLLVPAESSFAPRSAAASPAGATSGAPGQRAAPDTHRRWHQYGYYEIYRSQFSEEECRHIVSLHDRYDRVASKLGQSDHPIRDCNLFWIPRNDRTEWLFDRLWQLGKHFNEDYGFEIAADMGMAQLTRYSPGQQYDWHMDLGPKEASLRKISMVVQLSSQEDISGGGTEIFYGDALDNQVHARIGDVVVFPSFVMHRASVVNSGVRWSLVVWLMGLQPFR